jgi:hypothetical protein
MTKARSINRGRVINGSGQLGEHVGVQITARASFRRSRPAGRCPSQGGSNLAIWPLPLLNCSTGACWTKSPASSEEQEARVAQTGHSAPSLADDTESRTAAAKPRATRRRSRQSHLQRTSPSCPHSPVETRPQSLQIVSRSMCGTWLLCKAQWSKLLNYLHLPPPRPPPPSLRN